MAKSFETVLILQGGGSLGAYECGVFKTLSENQIKFDTIVGTSIGAVNAAVIAGSKKNPAKNLENFWHSLADRLSSVFPKPLQSWLSVFLAAMYGKTGLAMPIYGIPNPWMFWMFSPFLYDKTPLKKTLLEFLDFEQLNSQKPRIILTSVDILNGTSKSFDSGKITIDIEHVLASVGYPFYGIEWTKKNGSYLWDGSLLSNTPLREAIDASPTLDKQVYIVSLFPKRLKVLPSNMMESWHRARDLMHVDKTEHNLRMSRVISRYINSLKKMHDILKDAQLDKKYKQKFQQLEPEYHKLACKRGAIIQNITRIERQEKNHFLFEDADFALDTIRQLIQDGQNDAKSALSSK